MKTRFRSQTMVSVVILLTFWALLLTCSSPTKSTDELEGYTKIDRLATVSDVPDQFYFEVYLSVIQSETDWESGPTITFPQTSVWEYRAKTDIPGDNKLLINTSTVISNNGNNSTTFLVGFTKSKPNSFAVNNNGNKKGTVYFLFTKTSKAYSAAQYKL